MLTLMVKWASHVLLTEYGNIHTIALQFVMLTNREQGF